MLMEQVITIQSDAKTNMDVQKSTMRTSKISDITITQNKLLKE